MFTLLFDPEKHYHGKPCKYGVGGAMSYRHKDGQRRNAKTGRRLGGKVEEFLVNGPSVDGEKLHTKTMPDGSMAVQCYTPPAKANPGNCIDDESSDFLHCAVGGGKMGHTLASLNEAPFPLSLAEFFVLSFCPPGGKVLDPFSGSGTTAQAAQEHGRDCVGIDIRQSQTDLGTRRIT